MKNLRTDLALDARENCGFDKENEPEGIDTEYEYSEDASVVTVKIRNEKGAKLLGKPIGTYITIESGKLKSLDPESTKKLSFVLKEKLNLLISEYMGKGKILIVGLGNRAITPDALGPSVVSEIMVTGHLIEYMPELTDEGLASVCALAPGVLGITGVETSDIISSVCEKIKPSLVIAIDALASSKPSRISTTIQMTDTGINPGSGVGNKRKALNKEFLGVPVVAIGVPTVVDSASIISEALGKIHEKNKKISSEKDFQLLINEIYEPEENYMVTPREIDNMISHISKVVSNGINLALHKDIDLEYIESFTY